MTPTVAALAERAGTDLDRAPAEEIVGWAVEHFPGTLAVTASMADAVVVDLVSRAAPGVAVLFLDTGYHFPETLGTADAVEATYPVRLLRVRPAHSVAAQDLLHGPALHDRDPDLCCRLRKVAPLQAALAPYQAWVTGVRRVETPARQGTRVVEWDARRGKVKVNPIAAWTDADVERYVREHAVVVNPLLAAGYPSVGCRPCTRAVAAGADPRSGRWAGLAKSECGLHA